ncbi:MAG: LysR family transcriptional regulator [Lachnospiraceae bacterium]|nr:LysR family transcriptional regulator [Lachnospiraceae bacterium]
MNDLQIDYFLAMARNLSFSRTAEEFYVTQPAVSKQISSMEKELEVTLFDRTTKTIKLTEAGKLYQKYYLNVRRELEKVREEAKRLNQSRSGQIRLACLEGWDISGFFPEIMKIFSDSYPNVNVSLECYGIRDMMQALKNGAVDIILTLGVTLLQTEGIEIQQLTEIPKIILYSAHHRLADKEALKPQDFKDETFLVMSAKEASYAGDLVREYCKPYGFIPRIKYVRNIESMNACVQNNMGVIISDGWSVVKQNANLKYLKLNETHEISLAWITGTSNENVHVFANEMRAIFNKLAATETQMFP